MENNENEKKETAEDMEAVNETAIIEAILFLESEPVPFSSLVKTSKLSEEAVNRALTELSERFSEKEHGLELIEISNGYQFSPKQSLWNVLKDKYGKKNEHKLSKAALETLSIVAYSQPITKGEIENLRGVSADNMIRMLQDKGFIKEVGKKDAPGKPIQYGTTDYFLKVFRLKSIADLPKLNEIEQRRFELNG